MTVSSRTAAPSKALFRDLTCRSCLNVLLDPFAQKYCLHCGDAVLVNQCTCGRPVPHKSDGSLYNHCSTCGAGTDGLENKRPKIRLWAEEDLDIKCRCPCAGKTCTGKNATNDTDSQPPSKQQQFNYQQTPIFAKKRKRAKIKSNKENESSQSEAEPQETMAVYQPDPTRSEQGDTIHVEQLNNAGTSQIEMNVDLGGLEDNEGPTSIPRQRGSIARGPRLSHPDTYMAIAGRVERILIDNPTYTVRTACDASGIGQRSLYRFKYVYYLSRLKPEEHQKLLDSGKYKTLGELNSLCYAQLTAEEVLMGKRERHIQF